jgi:hypothetical protein
MEARQITADSGGFRIVICPRRRAERGVGVRPLLFLGARGGGMLEVADEKNVSCRTACQIAAADELVASLRDRDWI